mgnify:CR=1 FL=1
MKRIPHDVIFFLESPEKWIVYNVFTRTCLGLDNRAISLLGSIGAMPLENSVNNLNGEKMKIWEIEYFSNFEGLLADPTRYLRETPHWPEPVEVNAAQLLEALTRRLLEDRRHAYAEPYRRQRRAAAG